MLWWCLFLLTPFVHAQKKVVYGKYFRRDTTYSWKKIDIENAYFLYKPQPPQSIPQLPVVIQTYGDGWRRPWEPVQSYMGPFTKPNLVTREYVKRGIAYISLGYRAVDTRYWFSNPQGLDVEEELIHVDPEGRLTLDTTGKTMRDYKVRRCWMELIMKSIFDVVGAMENIIRFAASEGLDMQRVFFEASSAGSAEVNYLTWVYHKWNVGRYTPVGMMLTDPQLNLPIFCAMGDAVKTWVDVAGAYRPIKELMTQFECQKFIGNWRCQHGLKDNMSLSEVCNSTSNARALRRFCTAENFSRVTIGEVYQQQQWPRDDPEVGLGMEKLWYTTRNMMDHAPKPFHIYVSSLQHGMEHGGTSAFGYAKVAHSIGIDFVAYYIDRPGFRNAVPGFPAPSPLSDVTNGMLMEVESFPWLKLYPAVGRPGFEEHILYVCYVFKLPCAQYNPVIPRKLRGISGELSRPQRESQLPKLLYN